jgi:hypothetical protein
VARLATSISATRVTGEHATISAFVDGRSGSDIEEVLLLPETLYGSAARNRLLGPVRHLLVSPCV